MTTRAQEREYEARMDKWYREYQREHGKNPTWGELIEKGAEIAREMGVE